jgi:hypothetical protein
VQEGSEALRATAIAELVAQGIPVVAQMRPGERLEPEVDESRDAEGSGAALLHPIYDLTDLLVRRRWDELDRLPKGSTVLWPLAAGISDEFVEWRRGLESLRDRGVAHVQGLALHLSPEERRRLTDFVGDESFHSIFHRPPPAERQFARYARLYGFQPFLHRPLPAVPPRLRANRQLAGQLALAGELWMRLNRSLGRGQSFFRAARWVDAADHDVTALTREGNLSVVQAVDHHSRELLEEVVERGTSALVGELMHDYGSIPEGTRLP